MVDPHRINEGRKSWEDVKNDLLYIDQHFLREVNTSEKYLAMEFIDNSNK